MIQTRNYLLASTIFGILGVIMLGIDRLVVSANEATSFSQTFSVMTIIGLFYY